MQEHDLGENLPILWKHLQGNLNSHLNSYLYGLIQRTYTHPQKKFEAKSFMDISTDCKFRLLWSKLKNAPIPPLQNDTTKNSLSERELAITYNSSFPSRKKQASQTLKAYLEL